MAACKSQLQKHIFETPLPENPTLLEAIPPWSQMMSLKPTEERSSRPWKEPFSNGGECSRVHTRRSNSFSESLQLCTEGLGYESLDDVEDLKGVGIDEHEWQRDIDEHPNLKGGMMMMINRTKSVNTDDFPPPISCIGNSGKPWVGFKSYRYGGRFILKEIRVPTHEFLHASRENGRLKLHILLPNHETKISKLKPNEEQQEQIINQPSLS